jgi:hypothetical protein
MIPTAAALRTCALSTQGSPFSLPSVRTWRDRALGTGMGADSTFRSLHPTNNSIAANLTVAVPTAVVTPANAGRSGYGAAKQAAPPRGVPR